MVHGQPSPFFAIRDIPCVSVRVCWSPPLAATHHVPYPGRPPIVRPCPLLLYPFHERGNSTFLVALPASPSARHGSVLLERHVTVQAPPHLPADWSSGPLTFAPRIDLYREGFLLPLFSRRCLVRSLACAGDTIKHRNFHALAKRVRVAFHPPPVRFLIQNIEQTKGEGGRGNLAMIHFSEIYCFSCI